MNAYKAIILAENAKRELESSAELLQVIAQYRKAIYDAHILAGFTDVEAMIIVLKTSGGQ